MSPDGRHMAALIRRRCPLTGLGRLRRVRPLIPHIHAPHHSPTTPICKSRALIIPTAGESPGSGLPGESLVLCVRSTTNLAILVMTEVVSYRRLASRTTVLLCVQGCSKLVNALSSLSSLGELTEPLLCEARGAPNAAGGSVGARKPGP